MEITRLLIDLAFVILIWITQIIIYPTFKHIKNQSFVKWHNSYTNRISYFVAPLLFIQTGTISFQLFLEFDVTLIIDLTLLVIVWVYTFIFAIPIHKKLNISNERNTLVSSLIQINWTRTITWSLLFFCSVIRFLRV